MPIYPVPILKGVIPKISDSFGFSPKRGRLHAGSDIMYRRPQKGAMSLPVASPHYEMPHGVPALAFDSGVVTKAGQIGTGGRVEIDHGSGLSTKYFHLRDLGVQVGQRVGAGQRVGTIYHNPAGFKLNHLHFEVHKNGKQVDPAPFLRNAKMVDAPGGGFLIKVGIAVAIGLLASKYVFK